MLRLSSDLFATHFFECRFQLVWSSIHNSSRAILEMLWAAPNASLAGRRRLNHEHLAVVDAQLPAARHPKEMPGHGKGPSQFDKAQGRDDGVT